MALKDAVPLSPPLEEEATAAPQKRSMKRKRLTRLVSQEDIMEVDHRSTSPPRSVSEFDECTTERKNNQFVNPLSCPNMKKVHVAALRLEAELQPLRSILTRLMGHQTHNRKGIFNVPVDAEALGLKDYHRIVPKPMDLGTVKRRLHSMEYQSKDQAVSDIRTTFLNAMRFNPPQHPIHEAAKELLIYFEQAYMNVEGVKDKSFSIMVPVAMQPAQAVSSPESGPLPSLSAPAASLEASEGSNTPAAGDNPLVEPLPGGGALIFQPLEIPRKTSKLPPFLPHSCSSCQGRTCPLCQQGCLLHEPALMVCHGVHCGGARLRKGTMYYVSADGNRHFCERCYTNLTPVLPGVSENDPCRYKRDLLKRSNNEEIAEKWISCNKCAVGVHAICAMHNGNVEDDSKYLCMECEGSRQGIAVSALSSTPAPSLNGFTYVSGSDTPVSVDSVGFARGPALNSESLPECAISEFIQSKVAKCMKAVPNADKTITVRVISDADRSFSIPEVVRKHFRMATENGVSIDPPSEVNYRQKAITLFQKFDGLDVCIFCMYVQEYEGDHKYQSGMEEGQSLPSHKRRVYIAYIDSVEHFRPRECRTEVYHEILVSYLATARARGFETAHIWACPPSRGNSFVFWNHPSSQRTPNQDRLLNWYHGALSKAIGCGVVTDVKSLYSEFESYLSELESATNEQRGRMICPPLLDGDFWIEEAVRVHEACLARNIKVRAPTEVCVWNVTPLLSSELDPCPALQLAALIKDRVMTHPASVPFRRPVNAAAMKLQNYHEIVKKPMDLGTVYAQCVVGEYHSLGQVVDDVELMVSNAKRFNPVGHFVHTKADEVLSLFYKELAALVTIWDASTGAKEESKSWEVYAGMSMSLDERMEIISPNLKSASVFIEDDRSCDESRSLNSASLYSVPSSPVLSALSFKGNETDQELKISVPCNKMDKQSRRGKGRGKARRGSLSPKTQEPPKKLDLIADGPAAVMQRMVGQDFWMLDKRNAAAPPQSSTNGTKRRRSSCSSTVSVASSFEEPATKRRRQAWVGEEVSEAVRRMRTSFFTCSLRPKSTPSSSEQEKMQEFELYTAEFDRKKTSCLDMSSPICDARHALLEFSQYRCLEFDTLRRAKYSTAILLYHLNNTDAPGVVPQCSACDGVIKEVRWHKVRKATEKRRITKFMKPIAPEPEYHQEELCGCCHSQHAEKEQFIPIPVSLKRT
eukprot:CAMPEP_0176018066 /NCGR_PEP_ID=MMETSP0120_2-20121206/8685_1 /TAXON_ID=160619 /ORGANISM="Kryptoperidinium foliaceum, Strain CCMP 1326" /LENGTH=1204 /DNA_ID=CAMNT_0017351103 /DNA_START=437 /DNA_END=4051 /DNA_ORIENTATION=+